MSLSNITVSKQLLDESKLYLTDLDGKTATMDEALTDQLCSSVLGTSRRYHWAVVENDVKYECYCHDCDCCE